MIVDLANLEWWQAAVAILGALGLSPAPWILGLAIGRLQFSGPAEKAHEREVSNLKDGHARETAELVAHHARELAAKSELVTRADVSRDIERDARKLEAARATAATDRLAEVSTEAAKIAATTLAAIDGAKGKR